MKTKALIAMAVAGAFWSVGSIAGPMGHMNTTEQMHTTWPYDATEQQPSMSTILSLDNQTGGYKGWGPMANLNAPTSIDESKPASAIDQERAHQLQLAEVKAARDQVWVANAPLRSEYDNIGTTRGQEGRGFGRFFSR